MHTPLVSIIIPTYNRAHLILETLDSIVNQSYQNWECVIIDDGSTDNTADVILPFLTDARFRFGSRPNERPKGANACRNYGFEISRGELINWFDSDDVMLPDFLELKVELLQDMALDMATCYGAYFLEDRTNVDIARPHLDPDNYLYDFVTNKMFLSLAGPLWRRSFLENKVLFDETRQKIQDVEFHFRMLTNDLKMKFYSDRHLYLIRRGDERTSATATLSVNKLLDVFSYHFSTFLHADKLPAHVKRDYSEFTARKTFQSYYELIQSVGSLSERFRMLFKLCRKLCFTIANVDASLGKRLKYAIGILNVTLTRKGYKFFN